MGVAHPYLISQPHNVGRWHCPLCGEECKSAHPGKWLVPADSLEFFFPDQFPLLTTKRVFWKGVLEELLWFIKVRYLGGSVGGGPENGISRTSWWAVD